MENKKTKKEYTVEVTKESRALVTVVAESLAEATQLIKEQSEKKEINWTMEDHIIVDVVKTKEVKE